jgi:hypothetical protein
VCNRLKKEKAVVKTAFYTHAMLIVLMSYY